MSDVLRILDVNLNRARESLRVIEDHARFLLDDRDAAAGAKGMRHEIREIVEALGARELLAERDIAGDVGREVKTASEAARLDADDVLAAAFGRLSEAARAIAEYAKLNSPPAVRLAERLRYAGYELEQRITTRGGLRRQFRNVRLYVIVTEALCRRPWLEAAEASVRGGAGCIQLREKSLPDGELLRRARALRALTRETGALLFVNDRPDIARLAQADGVHVGQTDLTVAEVRRIGGGALLVGKSTHTAEQIDAAIAEQPDYIAVGPMFESTTKPQNHVAGVDLLRTAAARTELPLVAIGGITPSRAAACTHAGAACVCACSAVISADDPHAAAAEFRAQIG
jgi:thiamine-phosphate pyrophosphorylase